MISCSSLEGEYLIIVNEVYFSVRVCMGGGMWEGFGERGLCVGVCVCVCVSACLSV